MTEPKPARNPASVYEEGALLTSAAVLGVWISGYIAPFAPELVVYVIPALMIGVSLLASKIRDRVGAPVFELLFKGLNR